jgi:GNAT superfamily N-acetyltransferase
MTGHAVRRADVEEQDELIAVACRAFWPDPLLGFFSRGLLDEYERMPHFFGADLRQRFGFAETWVADHEGRIGALAMWIPPDELDRPALEEAMMALRASRILLRARHRVKAARLLLATERVRPEEVWYLALLGTDPAAQGRGLATALLAPVLARCDDEGIPAYLETQKASNVAWYARHGFVETGTVELEDTPKVWLLTRQPKAA